MTAKRALRRLVDLKPGRMISPACKVLRKGFAGGYHFKRVKVTGDERYHDTPNKNEFSHVHDALQYALSGGGEVRALTGLRGAAPPRPVVALAAGESDWVARRLFWVRGALATTPGQL